MSWRIYVQDSCWFLFVQCFHKGKNVVLSLVDLLNKFVACCCFTFILTLFRPSVFVHK